MDHIDDAARRSHPVLLELGSVVGALHGRVACRGGIVHHRVPEPIETDDDEQVSVRALEQEPVELVRGERDRRDERDSCFDELLGLGQRMELRDLAIEAEVDRVGDVEGPVTRAVVVVVEGVVRGVVDSRVARSGIVVQHVRVVARRRSGPPVRNDHRGRGRAAPGLAAVVILRVLAFVDLL